jgi:hypothetical protein
MSMEEIAGKRFRLNTVAGNAYLFVSDQEIMATVSSENDYKQAESRALVECVCRLASKGMTTQITLEDVVGQMRKSGTGRSTILTEIAGKIEEYLHG